MWQCQRLTPWSQWANTASVSVEETLFCECAFCSSQPSLNLCAAIEAGPQPNGVLRADIYNMVKEAWELTLEWVQLFNSGRKNVFFHDITVVLACSGPAKGCGSTQHTIFGDGRQKSPLNAVSFQQEARLKEGRWNCTGQ